MSTCPKEDTNKLIEYFDQQLNLIESVEKIELSPAQMCTHMLLLKAPENVSTVIRNALKIKRQTRGKNDYKFTTQEFREVLNETVLTWKTISSKKAESTAAMKTSIAKNKVASPPRKAKEVGTPVSNDSAKANQANQANQANDDKQSISTNQISFGDRGGYSYQNGYGNQGGYGYQNGYGNRGGYGNQGGYGNRGGYGYQNGYGNQNNYGNQYSYKGQTNYQQYNCFTCGKSGHFARNCNSRPTGNFTNTFKCKLCGDPHRATNCPKYKNATERRAQYIVLNKCPNCSTDKHSGECHLSRGCKICGKDTHLNYLCDGK